MFQPGSVYIGGTWKNVATVLNSLRFRIKYLTSGYVQWDTTGVPPAKVIRLGRPEFASLAIDQTQRCSALAHR